MKYIFSFLLLLTHLTWAEDRLVESTRFQALTGLQSFDVIALFPSPDEVDQKLVYEIITDSFKKMGKVTSSESESMLKDLLQSGASSSVCYLSFYKDDIQVEASLDVLVEAVVSINSYKTACPVWRKKLYASILESKCHPNILMCGLAQELIKNFGEDWAKANPLGAERLLFHIRKYKTY